MAVLIEARDLRKRFGAINAVDGISLEVVQGRSAGLSRPQRRRQIHHHEDADRLPRARLPAAPASPASTSPSSPSAAKAKLGYLPEGAPAYGDMTRAQLPARSSPRSAASRVPRPSAASTSAVEKTALRIRPRAEDRDALEGLQAPRRHGAGHPARPAGADHGRAHRRARSQPEAPGAQADHRHGRRTRPSSSPRTSWRRSRPSARAPSSSTTAASSPTAPPRT